MRRRTVLAAVGILASGCVTPASREPATDRDQATDRAPATTTAFAADCIDDWSPSIEAEEPTLEPGETGEIHISVTKVAGVNFRDPGQNPATFMLRFEEASFSPGPDYGSDGSPPGYGWRGCADVEITIPVEAPTDAEPAEYTFSVRVTSQGDDPEAFEREFSITVAES
jgi:hypothetical protein